MALNVVWSDRLEVLAEGLFASWEQARSGNPFARTCVVVGDMATRNWLRDYFLRQPRRGRRRILANLDFVPLAKFVNDWLAAETHRDGRRRPPSEHPFSKGVLAWRIDAILKDHADDPELAVLKNYISSADAKTVERKRFDLAQRLAQMYDDYLGARYRMLVNWERGNLPEGENRWQAVLYRLLCEDNGETYTRDFDAALAAGSDPAGAFANGFPRYEAVHVFDVLSAPWPYLHMLERLSGVVPVKFWNFNPSKEYWLDDPTKREAVREAARRLRESLEKGEAPEVREPGAMFDTPNQQLLGALASGGRGMFAAQLDLSEGDCEWAGDDSAEDFASMKQAPVELHVCHSPRRELEAARDALHRYFSENPAARPSDALVLCADWPSYSSLIESVFAFGGEAIPVALDGGVEDATPIRHSLEQLLDFGRNRFEASAVFSLLALAQIRRKFGIDDEGLSVLREMVRGNNIRWGYDDADVASTLGETEVKPCAFTWRRGLDRFLADALLGPREDPRELVGLGALGRLQPLGGVEEERARLVARLNGFVEALAKARKFLRGAHPAEAWRERLLQLVDDFYEPDADSLVELSGLRQAIVDVAKSAEVAGKAGKSGRRGDPVPGDVMCRAVLAAVGASTRRISSKCDAVRFAPLKHGTAVPAKFVWICGLNDGRFPKSDHRPSFDLIGQHPTMFDVTARERDAFAFLKAAMGARARLSFSYVGRNIRTNEEVPAAVPLIDLLEWLKSSGVEVRKYEHPLQAYSPRYFTPGEDLPRSYSSVNHDAAAALRSRTGEAAPPLVEVAPFKLAETGDTVIDLEELIAFYSRPNNFLARNRLGMRLSKPGYDTLSDDDVLAGSFSKDLQTELLLRGEIAGTVEAEAEKQVEEGRFPNAGEFTAAVEGMEDDGKDYRERLLKYRRAENAGFQCADMTAAKALVAWRDGAEPVRYHVELDVDGHRVVVNGTRRELALNVLPGGTLAHTFEFSQYPKIYDSTKIAAWIRHVAGHAAGTGNFVTVMMCFKDGPARTYRPIPADEARRLLGNLVAEAFKPMDCNLSDALAGGGQDGMTEGMAAAVGDFNARIVSTSAR